MIPQYLVDAICSWWTRRTLPNRLARALPDIVARKRKIEETKRRHKRSSPLYKEQRAAMTAALKGRM
ncbi:hypothetical protein EVC28_036 [Rhizobium phage RHph_I1_23]|nr:hypothetical protein EVC28_036 [Rhizobium phage RHph_I1_23]